MAISREEVLHVGRILKIRLSDQEAARFQDQFEDILNYMDRLDEVDTSNVEPLYCPHDGVAVTREDKAIKTCTRFELLANSPADNDEFFVVPRII